jgi:hypothetical protein
MGLTEVLTLIFVVLKLTGAIDWSWWLVLSPTLVGLAFVGLLALGLAALRD